MSGINIYQGDHVGLLRNISRTAIDPAGNMTELLENTLRSIGDGLSSNVGLIYEVNKSHGFIFVCGYKLEDPLNADCFMKLMKEQAELSLRERKLTYSYIDNSTIIYFVPLFSERFYGILALGFNKELDVLELEFLESISEILTSAVERFALHQQINQQYFSTVKSLVVAIEAKDVYTQGHSQRVADYSQIIGRHLKLKDDYIKELEITGLVHDIGKIGVSDQLLTKPDRLSDDEFNSIKQHPQIGSRILKPLNVSENVMLGTLLHHKRYDLQGYPANAEIDKLPLIPAIIGVADAYDAMTSERSYKKTLLKKDAVIELKKYRGTQFHPDIVDIMEELVSSNKL